MTDQDLLPHLFRTEYRKITAVLCRLFGLGQLEVAEDIAADTFLLASESWGIGGVPVNPTAWLYAVAKNKAIDYLRRNTLFNEKVAPEIARQAPESYELEIDLSPQHIVDSQLQMMFAVCHPAIPLESQIGLALRFLCGFGIEEIADAFLTGKATINKRLFRAKEKLRTERIKIEFPAPDEIDHRLDAVLRTLYLLFNEGYYSRSKNTTLRKDLCLEAMRLTLLMLENESTDKPAANALLALMCFHSSRFEARTGRNGEIILYEEQDESLWNRELVDRGSYFLNLASTGTELSKFHLEAGIAYWHTFKADSPEKWDNILQLYNRLLVIEYSPMAALNRTYALSKAYGKSAAIVEAEKLNLTDQALYHSLMGELYAGIDDGKALEHLNTALKVTRTAPEKKILKAKIARFGNRGASQNAER